MARIETSEPVADTTKGLTRRDFLIRSSVTATGAMLAIGIGPALTGVGTARAATPAFTPSIWFTMHPNGETMMHIVKAEMGQHIGTALAQIIAEELEVDWNKVSLDYPEGSVENFAKYGLAYTVNSGSVTTEFDRLSRAGAAGRTTLIEAGAGLLGAAVADCRAENSRVIDGATGRSIFYGEILTQTTIERTFHYPDDFHGIPLKDRADYRIIGQSKPPLDVPEKTNGQAKYGIDTFLPNMVYASLAIPRARYGAKALSVDDTAARAIPGFLQAVIVDDSFGKCTGWVLAIAEKFPAAIKAAQALEIEWDPGPYGDLSGDDLMAEYRALQADPDQGAPWVLVGDPDGAMAGADEVLEMEYSTAMVCHATMEPLNATAHQASDGSWHVYCGIQSTTFARMTLTGYLAHTLGKPAEEIEVVVHQSVLGGGFGGKQDYDEILAAAYASHVVGRPVKLIQTRESNFATSFPRTPTLHKLRAGLKDGQLAAMEHDIVCGFMGPRFSVGEEFGSDWLQLDADDGSGRDIDQWSIGGSDHWYSVPNHRVRSINHDPTTWAVQASALRTVSNSYNIFVVESFFDEVAHKLGVDPLTLRLSLLSGEGAKRGIPNSGHPPGTSSDYYLDRLWISLPWTQDGSWVPYESATVGGASRLANVLRVAAGKAGYGKQTPKNHGMGIAVSSAEERQSPTWVAGVAEVEVDTDTGAIDIQKLTIAMDMGIAVNPRNVEHQIKGAALWGASQVLSERLTLKDGAFEQSNFDTYLPIRLSDVPEIDVEIVESGHHPSGVGEPSSTVVAPAVANAVFDAVGVRIREMPITRDAVLKALREV